MNNVTPKELQWNYSHLIDQAKQIKLSIDRGNWDSISENLLERRRRYKIIRGYLDYCDEGNDCIYWRFCDVSNWHKKKFIKNLVV